LFGASVVSPAFVNDRFDLFSQLNGAILVFMAFTGQAVGLLMAVFTKTCIPFDLTGKGALGTAQNAGNQVKRFPPFSFKFDIMPLISNILAMQPHGVKVMRLLYEFREG
jgi:hypothetical protein